MEKFVEYLRALFSFEGNVNCSDLLIFKVEGNCIVIDRDFIFYKKIPYLELLAWKLVGEQELIDFILE